MAKTSEEIRKANTAYRRAAKRAARGTARDEYRRQRTQLANVRTLAVLATERDADN